MKQKRLLATTIITILVATGQTMPVAAHGGEGEGMAGITAVLIAILSVMVALIISFALWALEMAPLGPIRYCIVASAVTTAVIHLLEGLDNAPLLLLNGLGYFALVAALYLPVAILDSLRHRLRQFLIGYTLLAIVLFFVTHPWGMHNGQIEWLGLGTKVVELVLIALLLIEIRPSLDLCFFRFIHPKSIDSKKQESERKSSSSKENKMKPKLSFIIILIALLLAITTPVQASQPVHQNTGNPNLDAVIETAMRRHDVPGASVAVMKNGEVSWAKGYGLADTEHDITVNSETVFDAASIAKPVTAWGIMTLVEDGRLDLDAPISQYVTRWHLPPSEYNEDMVTARRILSHTAGLSTDGDVGVDPGAYVPTIEEAMDGAVLGMRTLHIAYPPGEDYHYSSVGYTLLELAVEEITGQPFAEYMQHEILDPLGMRNSSYGLTAELRAHAAIAHDWYNNPLPEYQYSTQAQGGLRTTPTDLALFMAAHIPGPNGEPIGRNVISPESVAEILTPVPFANEAESSHVIGLGFDLIMDGDTLIAARKTGDHRGFKPIIAMDFQNNEGIAIMSNSDRGAIGFLMNIACAWSANLGGNPLESNCSELRMIRNIQLSVAALIGLGALVYIFFVARDIRNGRRQVNWQFTWGRAVRVGLAAILLIVWWVFWHTDTLFTDILRTLPETAVTARLLVPWPTAFVWISRALTLLLLPWLTVAFFPKAN